MCAFYGMDDQEMIKHPEFVREDGIIQRDGSQPDGRKGKQILRVSGMKIMTRKNNRNYSQHLRTGKWGRRWSGA